MASNQDGKRGQLSFSEWCDRKFTNMYSHNEFASPSSQPIRGTAPKARPQSAPAKHAGRSANAHQQMGFRRVTSPSFSCSRAATPSPLGKDHSQSTKSSYPERWPKFSQNSPKIDVRSPGIRWCDKMKTLTVCDNLGRGHSSDAVFSEDTHQEENRISPRSQDASIHALKRTTEDVPDKNEERVRHVRRVSVDSGSSGQESHTSKRTYSELRSPSKKQTKSRKWKKRLRGPGSSPRKKVMVPQLAADDPEGPNQNADNSSSDYWGSSKVSCVWESTKVMTVETKSSKESSIRPHEETVNTTIKESSGFVMDENKPSGGTSKKSIGKGAASRVKYRNKSKKPTSQESHVAGRNGQVFFGEFEVESSVESENMRPQEAVLAADQANHSQIKRKNSTRTVARADQVKDTQWNENCLASTSKDSGSRNQESSLVENEENWEDAGRTSANIEQKSTKQVSGVKINCQSKPAKCHKILGEQTRRVPSGEYDVESSVDSEGTKHETVSVIASKIHVVVHDGSQVMQRGEIAKAGRKTAVDEPTKPGPIKTNFDVSAKKNKTGKPTTKMDAAKGYIFEHRRKSTDGLAHEEEKRLDEDAKPNKQRQKQSVSYSLQDTTNTVAPREEKKGKCHVKSIPSAKDTSTKDVKNEEKLKKEKDVEFRSPSPRDKTIDGPCFFTKRVSESVLKPQCSSKGAAKLRIKSAEPFKASRGTDRSQQIQRKSSWPGTKVRLEHIYQAFDDAISSASEDEHDKKSKTKTQCVSCNKSEELTASVHERQPCQQLCHEKIQSQTKEKMPSESPHQLSNKDAKNEQMEYPIQTEKKSSEEDKLDSKCVKPDGAIQPAPFTPKFISRSLSRNREQASGAGNIREMAKKTSKDVHVAGCSQEMPAHEKTKTDYIVEWLDKQDELPSNAITRKQQQKLEPGEVSDGSSESDEAWEQLVDSIMKGNNEEVFSSPYCKRVQQKRHATGLRSVTPFRTGSFPVEVDFKPRISPVKKNVATVSPYCVHPPTPQPQISSACTWSGPIPDFLIRNRPLTPSPPPFNPFSPVQNSPKVESTMDIESSISAFQGTQEDAETTQGDGHKRAPGEYPGNIDRSRSPPVMHADAVPVFSNTHKIRSVADKPPRFLRLAQLKANKSQPVSVHVSSRPPSSSGCIYPKGICRENLVSTSMASPSSAPQTSTFTPSGMASKTSYRQWSSGSVGWSSSLSRTPGTITPTRFTPWSNEVTTPSPWKTYHGSQDTSVELTSVVDYPLCSVPYIDTHCHIDFLYQRSEFRGTFEKFSKVHNFPGNYAGCLAVFCTPEAFEQGALWEDLVMEKNIWVAFGCHPHHAKSYDGIVEENIIRCMKHPKAIALGEIGLDYSNRCTSDRPLQLQVFRRQLQIALHMGKPLVIHSRDAEHDTLSVMTEIVPRNYKVHRHCFTGSPQEARSFFYAFPNSFIGLTALVTFPTAYPVHRTATEIPLGKILLETDAPYFLPKQCPRVMRWANPSMAVFVAVRIAQLRGLPLEEVLHAVRRNTTEMYGI